MPYPGIEDLPPPVRHVLPVHAQEIYRAAFNAAWASGRPHDEASLHRIAWAAVKRSYRKQGDVWVRRE